MENVRVPGFTLSLRVNTLLFTPVSFHVMYHGICVGEVKVYGSFHPNPPCWRVWTSEVIVYLIYVKLPM